MIILGQGYVFTNVCHSVHRAGLCMMSLPVWLPGPIMFLLGVSVPGPMFLPGRGSLTGVFLSRGSLCRGVSVTETDHIPTDPLYGEEGVVRIILECFLYFYRVRGGSMTTPKGKFNTYV